MLSLRIPEVVAWFVLSFDFYWFYKALMLTGSVTVAFVRIRAVGAVPIASRSRLFSSSAARSLVRIDSSLARSRVGGWAVAACGSLRSRSISARRSAWV